MGFERASEENQPHLGAKGIENAFRSAIAKEKSYSNAALVVFFLYFLFFIPGLICNMVILRSARRDSEVAGVELPGTKPLGVMLLSIGFFGSYLALIGIFLLFCSLMGLVE